MKISHLSQGSRRSSVCSEGSVHESGHGRPCLELFAEYLPEHCPSHPSGPCAPSRRPSHPSVHPSRPSHPSHPSGRPSRPSHPSGHPSGPSSPCCKGGCEPFKQLGKISEYKGLFDVLVKFRTWKDKVLGPLVKGLGTNYHHLLGTNRILHQLAELVTDSVEHRDLDELMHKVDGQLCLLGMHLNTLRDGPAKLCGFKRGTMKKMTDLQTRYATTMKCVQQRSLLNTCAQRWRPCYRKCPDRTPRETTSHHRHRHRSRKCHKCHKRRKHRKPRKCNKRKKKVKR